MEGVKGVKGSQKELKTIVFLPLPKDSKGLNTCLLTPLNSFNSIISHNLPYLSCLSNGSDTTSILWPRLLLTILRNMLYLRV